MALSLKTSLSMAYSFAGSFTTAPTPPQTPSNSLPHSTEMKETASSTMDSTSRPQNQKEFSLYKGISNRPLGWKHRKSTKPPAGQTAHDAKIKRWDGAARTTTEWDGLRRDPELWYPDGDCLIHLYEKGQSRRGPAFQVSFKTLLDARCRPFLDRFLVHVFDPTPHLKYSDSLCEEYFDRHGISGKYELYIPAPVGAERTQAMLHHITTRNFVAWVFGKPMVGSHLGGALVDLLNFINEFRSINTDVVQDVLDYMDAVGYSDMRNQPDYALAILYFAEHFQFQEIWLDAYAHCCGMEERLPDSPEFEHINGASRTLIRSGRLEMDDRLDRCGKSLGTFLEDELSSAHVGLSVGARAHLDHFRSFLQAYYVEKLGYYPPSADDYDTAKFPKQVLNLMAEDIQHLYAFLVDSKFTPIDCSSVPTQGGICVLQNVQAFDQRLRYEPLKHPLPLMPEALPEVPRSIRKRMSWVGKPDKLQPDERLVILSSLAKASNRGNAELMKCSLVRAYCEFENEYVVSDKKGETNGGISVADARKVRWILIYALLQTLLSATRIPHEVRDIDDIPYNLCVVAAGRPSWLEEKSSDTSLCSAAEQDWDDHLLTGSTSADNTPSLRSTEPSVSTIKPDIDYFQSLHEVYVARESQMVKPSSPAVLRKSTVRRALSTLGNMPELRHPMPFRTSFHEILVHGYGNGPNTVNVISSVLASTSASPSPESSENSRKTSSETDSSVCSPVSPITPTWTHHNGNGDREFDATPPSSISEHSRRGSDSSVSKSAILDLLEGPIALPVPEKNASKMSASVPADLSDLVPPPLDLKGMETKRSSVIAVSSVRAKPKTVGGVPFKAFWNRWNMPYFNEGSGR